MPVAATWLALVTPTVAAYIARFYLPLELPLAVPVRGAVHARRLAAPGVGIHVSSMQVARTLRARRDWLVGRSVGGPRKARITGKRPGRPPPGDG